MALPAGRVGVKRDSVDWQGNVKGNGGSSDTYTKQQIDSKFGGLTFRDNEGTPQVKTADGEWVNFNSGGGGGIPVVDINATTEVKSDLLVTFVRSNVQINLTKIEIYKGANPETGTLIESVDIENPTFGILLKNMPSNPSYSDENAISFRLFSGDMRYGYGIEKYYNCNAVGYYGVYVNKDVAVNGSLLLTLNPYY